MTSGITAVITSIQRHANQTNSSGPDTEERARLKLLSVRVPEDVMNRLDLLEARAKAAGVSHANRSWLVREALTSFLDGVEEEVPLST